MNLHKAYNSLELYVRGDCKKGRRLAKRYLKRADKALSKLITLNVASELELPLQMLWEMRKNDDLTVFDVEGVKAEVQFVAQKKKLASNLEEWLNEIIDKCN